MTIRSASWLAAAALAATAVPALAQDGYQPGPPPPLPPPGAWEEEWTGSDDGYPDEDARWEEQGLAQGAPPQQLGYSPEQRAQWLEQCRATYYRDGSGRESGQVIGGVLGGVAGGVVGSEIAEGDDNLGGVLVGAGVGALAGAAVGGAIGAEADRDRADQCESYLLRYEQSLHGPGPGYAHGAYGYAYPYPYPVMWVRVPIHTRHGRNCGCPTVVEEVVVEEQAAPPPARRTKIQRIAPAPAPRPDKRVRTGS